MNKPDSQPSSPPPEGAIPISLDDARQRATAIRDRLPTNGLFANHSWRISPTPFPLGTRLVKDLEKLGRVLLQFYRATDVLYRKSAEGKLPPWIATLCDQGKPDSLLQIQRASAFKPDLPRVIRPDILLTDDGFSITELDSVPGGIGLTAWLNETYASLPSLAASAPQDEPAPAGPMPPIGGADGMITGFRELFGDAKNIHLVVSEESATYRPEMQWMAERINPSRPMSVREDNFRDFETGDAVYRFFELFDLPNVPNADAIMTRALAGEIKLTAPPKTYLEEKLVSGLLWNRNLNEFWRQELGNGFLRVLQQHIPYTWILDPSPLPPHAAYPELGITDWSHLKSLSQKERRLILKISGFAPEAWGARGVHLGNDLSTEEWSNVVDHALRSFPTSPHILQRFTKPRSTPSHWFDFESDRLVTMNGRVRLCPYYLVEGQGDQARANLRGCLATICPADKKIIHGMSEAILAPCSV